MKRYIGAALAAALTTGACASSPDSVQAQYISPAQYASYGCNDIEQDLRDISLRVHTLTAGQRRRANQDAWATGVGLVVFWPALFFLMRGDKADELARMKGEYDALVTSSRRKDCTGLQQALANPIV
jgi:hypothetical protein